MQSLSCVPRISAPEPKTPQVDRFVLDQMILVVAVTAPLLSKRKQKDKSMQSGQVELTTRAGVRLFVRPVEVTDAERLEEFFTHVTREDLRFRYLVGIDRVGDARIAEMTGVDHVHVENFLAFGEGSGPLVATATLACDPTFERAEVAITVHEDFKDLGIGWELLAHLAEVARAKGVKVLESIEQRDNHAAIELERHMGFTAVTDPDDPTLLLVRKELG
jgi:GNAT superfamily N-acetyltransferase